MIGNIDPRPSDVLTDATRICHSYFVPQTRRRVIYLEALAYVHATNLKQKLLRTALKSNLNSHIGVDSQKSNFNAGQPSLHGLTFRILRRNGRAENRRPDAFPQSLPTHA